MKKIFKIIFFSILVFFATPYISAGAQSLSQKLSGKILLQVESHGEAWYVDPQNHFRYYLGRPEDMLSVMRERGVGISNNDLMKIPEGVSSNIFLNTDDPRVDYLFSSKHKGKIFLQVEAHGEAWYVNPGDGRRYYLGSPNNALGVVRRFGLGIRNIDLEKISRSPQISSELLRLVYEGINKERTNNGLKTLQWNNELASVALEHSQALAEENKKLTGLGYSCEFTFIHHEGLVSGLYHYDRLNQSGVYYFEKSAENIALVPRVEVIAEFSSQEDIDAINKKCVAKQVELPGYQVFEGGELEIVKAVRFELAEREESFKKENALAVKQTTYYSSNDLADSMVSGWMNSPGHRKNILDINYDETGIGLAEVNGYLIGTQVFIKRAVCGYQAGVCCEKNGYYPYCFTGLSCVSGYCQA